MSIIDDLLNTFQRMPSQRPWLMNAQNARNKIKKKYPITQDTYNENDTRSIEHPKIRDKGRARSNSFDMDYNDEHKNDTHHKQCCTHSDFPFLHNFDKVIIPLSKYYDENRLQVAVNALKQYYEDEGYDNEQIIEDWTPNDFDNCIGIDVFTDALNYSDKKVNNETNKKILFEWFCWLMLPKKTMPLQEPLTIKEKTIYKYEDMKKTIFKPHNNKCEWIKNEECTHLERLVFALNYYSKLNLHQNKEKIDEFASFIFDVYNTQLLDDWHHILSKHGEHLQQIKNKYFKNTICIAYKCAFSRRHYKRKENDLYSSFVPKLRFFAETLDCAHFHFMHLYETGLRRHKNDKNKRDIQSKRWLRKCKRFTNGNKYALVQNVVSENSKITFSIGYRFYYWPMYEQKEEYDEIHVDIKVCDLFIKKKFDDFKSEILADDDMTNNEYERIMQKASELQETEKVKRITAEYAEYAASNSEITEGTIISIDHLIAIILYCDYGDHCSRFSESFRSLRANETLKETKKRNRNYYWMARRLREVVDVFGKTRWGNAVTGPFYCGINQIMIIPQFKLHLYSPTSTTLQQCVADEFAGDNGMILQLNNDCGGDDGICLKLFDASFIGLYAEEQERLFMGSIYSIRLQTIILTQSRKDYKYFIKVLYAIDLITSKVSDVPQIDVDKKTSNHIERLFEYRLRKKIDEKMDKYVYEMFDAYCKHKRWMTISLPIFDQFKHLSDLFVHSYQYDEDVYSFEVDKDVYLREDNDKTNLLRPELAKIFSNVIKVHIDALHCSFSLIGFLDVLKISNWKRIGIQGGWSFDWIEKLVKSSKWPLIVKQYESNNYKIEVEYGRNLHIHAHHP